jgi:hypothetical protein
MMFLTKGEEVTCGMRSEGHSGAVPVYCSCTATAVVTAAGHLKETQPSFLYKRGDSHKLHSFAAESLRKRSDGEIFLLLREGK